jgi:hypothetical protein
MPTRRLPRIVLLACLFCPLSFAPAAEPVVHIDCGQELGRLSRYLTGACIEDVNHEIYGGIFSQMIFGESFQEPPAGSPLSGFQAYDGNWSLHDDEVWVGGGPGPKLVSELADFVEGEAGVEVFFTDRQPGNAGLIVRVSRAKSGADNFDGYEVSLNPQAQTVLLGRHRHNWHPLAEANIDVPTERWIKLSVRMAGRKLAVEVDGRRALEYEDAEPLGAGTVGLRPWQREARFRNLWARTGGQQHELPFKPRPHDRGPVSGMWRPIETGSAQGEFVLERDRPFVGGQSQRITFTSGDGAVGIENRGLNRQGLCFVAGKPYEGHLWARCDEPTSLRLALESGDGSRQHAHTTAELPAGDWQRLEFTLTPEDDEEAGRFSLARTQPGSATLGYVYLQPGPWGRFQNLPDRKDVVEGLIEQGLTVLRYGGSMVNHPEYRWKKMTGPRDRRPPNAGTWYPYSTNGWGILDFLDLCEAAGFLGVPDFNMGESPADMADFVEYVNGPASSEWGQRRAADGHPRPYGLRHIQLGNEERIDDAYFERFEPLAKAIWAKDPRMVIVVGDFAYDHPISDPFQFTGAATRITSLAAHQRILRLAHEHRREVWFDVHVGTDGPNPSGSLLALPTYVEALRTIADSASHKVVVFEFNSGNHAFRRALANAQAINVIERLAGQVAIAASANCLQVDGQNDNDWNQGLLFMNPCRVWPQPPYFVTQMVARHYQPVAVRAVVEGGEAPQAKLDVSAKRSDDGHTLVLQVVNLNAEEMPCQLRIDGFQPSAPLATIEELSAPLAAVNTADDPERVQPRTRRWRHHLTDGAARYVFPARSFSVLRFE